MEETVVRPFRRAGFALVVVLTAAALAPAAESTATAQLSSPVNSSQPADPVARPSSVKNSAAATERPYDFKPRWETLAQSGEGRRIEFAQFGVGERHVLVVGPLAGDEPGVSVLTSELAAHLARFPRRLAGTTVTIVRDPNPDGRARRTASNGRGVLLDRNFPTKDWHKIPSADRLISGREPQSEPETKALVDLVTDIKPACVVLLAASRGQGVIHYCGPADELARKVGAESRLPVAQLNSSESGALMAYTGLDRAIATVRIAISLRSNVQAIWSNYKRALLLAIDCADEESVASTGKSNGGHAVARPSPPAPLPRGGEGGNAAARPSSPTPLAQGGDAKNAAPAPVHRTAKGDVKNAPIPVRTVAGKAADAPSSILRYDDLKNGLPVVPVKRPAAAIPSKPVAPAPRSRPDYVPPVGEAAILRRLPSVDRISPPPAIPQHARLPQPPIPLYPETGYELLVTTAPNQSASK